MAEDKKNTQNMGKENKVVFNKKSKLIIFEHDGQEIVNTPFGTMSKNKIIKYEADGDINLGSVSEPNRKITSIIYDIPFVKLDGKI